MTALDGWVHDKYGTSWMLHFDALSGIVCIIVAMFVLKKIKATPDNPLKTPNRR
jgi:predicted 3-demethylubiquinone-9 3-methyltransferase (glyoxalase superfamily)